MVPLDKSQGSILQIMTATFHILFNDSVVMNLSFDVTHYVAWTTDISIKWAMNKQISGKRYEVFIVQTLLRQLNM